jgi:hypothetical protein
MVPHRHRRLRLLAGLLAWAAMAGAIAAVALPGDALGQQTKPVFAFRGDKEPVLGVGLGPSIAFNQRSGLLHLFVTLRLAQITDLYIERGSDDDGLFPYSYFGDNVYTTRKWWLVTVRWFFAEPRGWYLAAGAADGSIEQSEGTSPFALVANARFAGPLIAFGWQGRGTFFVTASLRLAKVQTSQQEVYLPAEFDAERFDRARQFSHASLGFGWRLF